MQPSLLVLITLHHLLVLLDKHSYLLFPCRMSAKVHEAHHFPLTSSSPAVASLFFLHVNSWLTEHPKCKFCLAIITSASFWAGTQAIYSVFLCSALLSVSCQMAFHDGPSELPIEVYILPHASALFLIVKLIGAPILPRQYSV